MPPTILGSLGSLFQSTPPSSSTTRRVKKGSESSELKEKKKLAFELWDEMTFTQIKISRHVQRYHACLRMGMPRDAVENTAYRTSMALGELHSVVDRDPYREDGGWNEKSLFEAGKEIDTLRNIHQELNERSLRLHNVPFADTGLEKCYQKGQTWLLSAYEGTEQADALLWHFTNRQHPHNEDGASEARSENLWPPNARSMKQTRAWLSPTKTWFGKPEFEIDGCKYTVDELKAMHHSWAAEDLAKKDGVKEWERRLMSKALEISNMGVSIAAEEKRVAHRGASVGGDI